MIANPKLQIFLFPFVFNFFNKMVNNTLQIYPYLQMILYMPGNGFDQIKKSFNSFRKLGKHFITVIPIAFKDQEVAFQIWISFGLHESHANNDSFCPF